MNRVRAFVEGSIVVFKLALNFLIADYFVIS